MKQKKYNLSDCLTLIVRSIFIFLMIWILVLSLTNIQLNDAMSIFRSKPWLTILLASGSVTLFMALFLLTKSKIIKSKRLSKIIVLCCAGLIIILQLICIIKLRIQFRYDSMEVFEEACRLVKTGQIANWDYYGANAHQRGTLYLTWGLLKLAALFHIPETMYVLYLDLWCMVFVDSCLLGAGYYLYKRYGRSIVTIYAVVCLIQPFTYVWCVFYYTTIQCLPFMTLGMLFVLLLPDCNKIRHKILAGVLLGANCYLGYHIRPTILIVLVALIIYIGMQWLNDICNLIASKRMGSPDNDLIAVNGVFSKQFRRWIGNALAVVCFVITFMILGLAYNRLDQRMVTIDTDSYERPMLFWVAMSAKGDGTWDGYDAEQLARFTTKEEKAEYASELLKQRLSALDAKEAFSLISNKLRVTWAEGNDDAISENATSLCYGGLYDVLIGDDSLVFLYFCQIVRIVLLFCVLAGAVITYKTKGFHEMDYMRLAVLGGILFHIIWEAKRLYSLPFMPFLLVLMLDGIWQLKNLSEQTANAGQCKDTANGYNNAVRPKRLKMSTAILPALSMVLIIVWVLGAGRQITTGEQAKRHYAASQLMERCDIKRGLLMGESIRQEFMADRAFDTIGIQTRNYSWFYGRENESQYRMTITDSQDNVLRQALIYGKDFEDYEFCDTSFEAIIPKKGGELYRVTIDTVYADDISYLVFYKKASDSIDPYPWGNYVENGVLMDGADMTFRVYEQQNKPLMSLIGLLIFACVHLIIQIIQFFSIKGFSKKTKEPII